MPIERAQDLMPPLLTACQKADSMWSEKIVPSRYDHLPPLTSPGVFDLFKLATSSFSIKALTTEGDELEVGRRKLIHSFGAEARLKLVINPDAVGGYTGIFHSGSECIVGRFSLASKPTKKTSIPALALKIFVDGGQPSVNVLLLHSVDDQEGHNFFAQSFSNILPPASALSTRILASGFERSAEQFGAKDSNSGRLTLENLSGTLPNGIRILAPKTPYQLIFKPTVKARELMQDANSEDDFRLKLAGLPIDQVLYDIYTLAEGEPTKNATHLGQLILVSPIVSSRYGDEKLYFKHNMERKERGLGAAN